MKLARWLGHAEIEDAVTGWLAHGLRALADRDCQQSTQQRIGAGDDGAGSGTATKHVAFVIDVGVNDGQGIDQWWALFRDPAASPRCNATTTLHVVLFEPQTKYKAVITGMMQEHLRRWPGTNASFLQNAIVGDDDDRRRLVVVGEGPAAILVPADNAAAVEAAKKAYGIPLPPPGTEGNPDEGATIVGRSLFKVLEELGYRPPEASAAGASFSIPLLKIDAEGADASILRSVAPSLLRPRRVRLVVFEMLVRQAKRPFNASILDSFRVLRECGYRVFLAGAVIAAIGDVTPLLMELSESNDFFPTALTPAVTFVNVAVAFPREDSAHYLAAFRRATAAEARFGLRQALKAGHGGPKGHRRSLWSGTKLSCVRTAAQAVPGDLEWCYGPAYVRANFTLPPTA